jgi:hypothetical protein
LAHRQRSSGSVAEIARRTRSWLFYTMLTPPSFNSRLIRRRRSWLSGKRRPHQGLLKAPACPWCSRSRVLRGTVEAQRDCSSGKSVGDPRLAPPAKQDGLICPCARRGGVGPGGEDRCVNRCDHRCHGRDTGCGRTRRRHGQRAVLDQEQSGGHAVPVRPLRAGGIGGRAGPEGRRAGGLGRLPAVQRRRPGLRAGRAACGENPDSKDELTFTRLSSQNGPTDTPGRPALQAVAAASDDRPSPGGDGRRRRSSPPVHHPHDLAGSRRPAAGRLPALSRSPRQRQPVGLARGRGVQAAAAPEAHPGRAGRAA